MKSSFSGMPPQALAFLRGLEKNNRREWFEERKAIYLEQVRSPMEELCARVGSAMTRFAPDYVVEPKQAIYRIYRDTRFSSDKTPYKTHVGALFYRPELGRNNGAAFYFEVSHRYVGVAGGIYMPTPDHLRAVRAHLLEHHARLEKLLRNRALSASMGELQGEALARPPKGYPPDHAAIGWIRHKQWYFWQELDPKLATRPKVADEIVSRFRKMTPVVEFLNEPLIGLKPRKTGLLIDL